MRDTVPIAAACKVRPEVARGELFDVVKLHRATEPQAFEANSDFVWRVPYPSEARLQLIEAIGRS